MEPAPTTLTDLLQILSDISPELPAIFRTDQAEIGPGYHITELKLAEIDSIDCIGRRSQWSEAQLQLLDGRDGETLTAGKISAILERCLVAIPALGDVPLTVEFAHKNYGLGKYRLGVPDASRGRLQLPLIEARAQCKPAVDISRGKTGGSCCG